MAQRWTLNEDIVVCKYCIENPWAYDSDEHMGVLATKLEKIGGIYINDDNIAYQSSGVLLSGLSYEWREDIEPLPPRVELYLFCGTKR